jgi:hypothetical protein
MNVTCPLDDTKDIKIMVTKIMKIRITASGQMQNKYGPLLYQSYAEYPYLSRIFRTHPGNLIRRKPNVTLEESPCIPRMNVFILQAVGAHNGWYSARHCNSKIIRWLATAMRRESVILPAR